jgi:hypothetical protein
VLVVGILLAIAKRRIMTKWIQAAGLSEQFQRVFYHLTKIGRKYLQLFEKMLEMILEQLKDQYYRKFKPKTEITVNIVKEILPHFKPFNKLKYYVYCTFGGNITKIKIDCYLRFSVIHSSISYFERGLMFSEKPNIKWYNVKELLSISLCSEL